jgi:hypothetical protein
MSAGRSSGPATKPRVAVKITAAIALCMAAAKHGGNRLWIEWA